MSPDFTFDPTVNNEPVYDEKIYPLMKQIIAICKEHHIPMIASFQYDSDGFCTSSNIPPGSAQSFMDAHFYLKPRR